MDVFLCWSGETSEKLARALQSWLMMMLSPAKVFLSSNSIRSGHTWLIQTRSELERTHFGILCITPTNAEKPWINFEAGALAKKVEEGRVVPLLFGEVEMSDLPETISQFQAKRYSEEGMRELVNDVNEALPEGKRCDEESLLGRFRSMWQEFAQEVEPILSELVPSAIPTPEPSEQDQMLDKLLEIVQSTHVIVARQARESEKQSRGGFGGGVRKAAADLAARQLRALQALSDDEESSSGFGESEQDT